VLLIGAIVGLIPSPVYLAGTLPDRYVTYNWTAAFTTGVLLVCDAWFDVMTAAPSDRLFSILIAVLGSSRWRRLIIGALRILRLTATRLWLLSPHTPLWQVPLLP